MKTTSKYLLMLALFLGPAVGTRAVAQSRWIQPSVDDEAPVWGLKNGIRIGLDPASIRGLIHVYTPYLDRKNKDVINFIAIEPIVRGSIYRGFSELEKSALDSVQGKRIWSSDSEAGHTPRETVPAARGVISTIDGTETLTVFLFVEPFDNGAKVYVRARFHADRPCEIEFSTFRYEGSAELESCVVTATMGNYARLRTLWLGNGETRNSKDVWPDYAGDGFAPHEFIAYEHMIRGRDGFPYFIASPDEENPGKALYDERTPAWWRYYGRKATQYWYCKTPEKELTGVVNGRVVYWGDLLPIPGGISYENFEMKQPYSPGGTFVFGVTPLAPESFIKTLAQ